MLFLAKTLFYLNSLLIFLKETHRELLFILVTSYSGLNNEMNCLRGSWVYACIRHVVADLSENSS